MIEKNRLSQMKQAIVKGDKEKAQKLARQAVEDDLNLNDVIEEGFVPGIQEAGNLWEKGEYFLPELITSAESMKAVMSLFQPELEKKNLKAKSLGTVIIGTIEGDIHDIGKNLVASLLSANGFDVKDLGADVKISEFIQKAENEEADFICVSSLLTTTMLKQKDMIKMLKSKNLYGKFKVLVGGAPVNKKWAQDIGADGYAENAMSAAKLAKTLAQK
ncbi:MAG: dimethylamine corrinoid protein 3 [Candidatus Aminicenantes bacterium]|nr:dimethylamine corrinoid protein 3 [Candidatus Aminicenantes bacterium]